MKKGQKLWVCVSSAPLQNIQELGITNINDTKLINQMAGIFWQDHLTYGP